MSAFGPKQTSTDPLGSRSSLGSRVVDCQVEGLRKRLSLRESCAVLLFIGARTACLDSHHAPYGVVAPGENDRELIGLSVAGDFQLFHTMLLTRHCVRKKRRRGDDCLERMRADSVMDRPLSCSMSEYTCIYPHSKRA